MTKIITWCELRYLMLAELEALFRARRARFARAQGFARQPRKRPPRQGGAPYPAAEAVSARFNLISGGKRVRSGLQHDVFEFLARA